MHKERFAKLIKAVGDAPPPTFDMRVWMNECGTAACAVGTYCLRHPRADLYIIRGWTSFPALRSNDAVDFTAVAEHFGITVGEAFTLFFHGSYTDTRKRNVLARLKKFYNDQLAAKRKGKVTA